MPAITPKEAINQAINKNKLAIPEFVIDIFNTLIIANMDSSTGISKIWEKDIIDNILTNIPIELSSVHPEDYHRQMIDDRGWLNISPIYMQSGWEVVITYTFYGDGNVFTFKQK